MYPSKFYGLEYIESENVVTSVNNVYLNGVRIAALAENGSVAYYLTDQVDSVSHVLDDDGKTLSKMQYLPYGETFVHRGDTDFAPKYNSQELDRESGFYFYNARYYDPGIARFTSADTVIDGEWDTQGWNRFSYVKGNPIGAKDPTGHCFTQGMRSFFAATCSNASAQADKATHQDINNRINYQNESSFLKTATVVNGLAKGTPTNAGVTLAMKAAEKIPVVKEGNAKLNEKLYGNNPKIAELVNFGVFMGSTMIGLGTTNLGGPTGATLRSGGEKATLPKSIWSSTKKKTSTENAYSHWKDHGKEFPEFQNSKQYVDGTHKFIKEPPFGTFGKYRSSDNAYLQYNPKTNTFAASKDGVPKTMFKPKDNINYWNKQK